MAHEIHLTARRVVLNSAVMFEPASGASWMFDMMDRGNLVAALGQQALRNVVLLKYLLMYPERTVAYGISHGQDKAFIVILDASASAYDREMYPSSKHVVLISSDSEALTRRLLDFVPCDGSIVFKLSSEEDRAAVATRFSLRQTAAFHSYTAHSPFERDPEATIDRAPTEALMALAESQGQERVWIEKLLAADRAFFCSISLADAPVSFCLAFQNFQHVWEVGSVLTLEQHRGHGYAARVVRTAHAVLAERQLMSRYQVQRDNIASISLARKIGLKQFLTLRHYMTVS